MILAGDVGGTKILLEVGDSRSGRWTTALARRYSTEQAESFSDVLDDFLAECEKSGVEKVRAAAFGVAGPVTGNRVKMTNRPWIVDGDLVARRCGIGKVRVVNDLGAAGQGIDWIGAGESVEIQPGEAAAGEPRVVLGVGTGLGISYILAGERGLNVVSGEGGHAGFAPATLDQAGLWRSVFEAYGRVSAEMILSGAGLANCYAHLRGLGVHAGSAGGHPLPEEISRAAEDGDALCAAALDLFVECLGTVAGDHALAAMARGGVFLTGGIVGNLVPRLRDGRFREAFCAKSPFDATLMKIPVRAVTSERVGLLGAARIASAL